MLQTTQGNEREPCQQEGFEEREVEDIDDEGRERDECQKTNRTVMRSRGQPDNKSISSQGRSASPSATCVSIAASVFLRIRVTAAWDSSAPTNTSIQLKHSENATWRSASLDELRSTHGYNNAISFSSDEVVEAFCLDRYIK